MWLLYLPLVVPARAGVAAHPIAGRLEPPHATAGLHPENGIVVVPGPDIGTYEAPPRRQMLLPAVCTLVVLGAGAAALLAATDLHALVELAQGAH